MTNKIKILKIIYSFLPEDEKNKCDVFNFSKYVNKTLQIQKCKEKCNAILSSFQNTFNSFIVVDWTDFDSGNCCELKILLHENENLIDDDKALLKKLGGKRRDLRIFLSLISEYCFYFVEETEYNEKTSGWTFTSISENEAMDSNTIKKLNELIKELGYTRINQELAKMIVPDIKMDFIDAGNVTVFNCLFTDLIELFDSKVVYE